MQFYHFVYPKQNRLSIEIYQTTLLFNPNIYKTNQAVILFLNWVKIISIRSIPFHSIPFHSIPFHSIPFFHCSISFHSMLSTSLTQLIPDHVCGPEVSKRIRKSATNRKPHHETVTSPSSEFFPCRFTSQNRQKHPLLETTKTCKSLCRKPIFLMNCLHALWDRCPVSCVKSLQCCKELDSKIPLLFLAIPVSFCGDHGKIVSLMQNIMLVQTNWHNPFYNLGPIAKIRFSPSGAAK